MSLIKLANKLTKMFNGLSAKSKKLAKPILRSKKQFISGIEQGNENLINRLKNKGHHITVETANWDGTPFNWRDSETIMKHNNEIVIQARKPISLVQAITKRHEISETQQMLDEKKWNPKLQKAKAWWLKNGRKKYYGHANPQVLFDESHLIATTPNANRIPLIKIRRENGEISDLKNKFNLNYGIE